MTGKPDGIPSHVEKSRRTPADPTAAAFDPENRWYTATIAALLALLAFLVGQMLMAGFVAAAVAFAVAVFAVVVGGLDELWCRCKATHTCHSCQNFRDRVVEADLVDDYDESPPWNGDETDDGEDGPEVEDAERIKETLETAREVESEVAS